MSRRALLLAASSNQARLMVGLADALRGAGVEPVYAAADHRVRSVDSAERTLAGLEVPFVRYPFRDLALTRALPGRRKFRAPASGARLAGWLRGLEVDVVAVGHDSRPVTVAALRAARRLGVPTALIQDGARPVPLAGGAAPRARRRLLPERYRRFGHGGCDRIAVAGASVADRLVAEGVPAERIVVTGYPPYDRYAHEPKVPVDGPTGDPARVVYIGQTLELAPELLAGHLVEVAAVVTGLGGAMTYKAHPRDAGVGRVAELVAERAPEVEMVRDVAPEALLRSATVVLTAFSTMALEAMAVGVPVVLLDLLPVSRTLDLGPAVPHVRRHDELRPALAELLRGGRARQEAIAAQAAAWTDACHAEDGRAGERVAGVLAELARWHHVGSARR